MTRVMAQGTFDLLHPGHVHYLEESAALGDDLHVVIARDSRKRGEGKEPVMPEDARRAVVAALEVVDTAVLGSEDSIFDTVEQVDPDIITLGHDQGRDEEELAWALADHGFPDVAVRRMPAYTGTVSSSTELRRRAAERDV
ncbi:MAG: adenylyltransferase/cytidyltransferase family protein [Candidatus Nanohaloarchaea archaeon]|nr:adenylyltransferase/cytidyltransferase family protein [Candidatus Nanohaloarchaea archaeon]